MSMKNVIKLEHNYSNANQVIFRYYSALIGNKTSSDDSDCDLSHKKVYESNRNFK